MNQTFAEIQNSLSEKIQERTVKTENNYSVLLANLFTLHQNYDINPSLDALQKLFYLLEDKRQNEYISNYFKSCKTIEDFIRFSERYDIYP